LALVICESLPSSGARVSHNAGTPQSRNAARGTKSEEMWELPAASSQGGGLIQDCRAADICTGVVRIPSHSVVCSCVCCVCLQFDYSDSRGGLSTHPSPSGIMPACLPSLVCPKQPPHSLLFVAEQSITSIFVLHFLHHKPRGVVLDAPKIVTAQMLPTVLYRCASHAHYCVCSVSAVVPRLGFPPRLFLSLLSRLR